MGLGMPWAPIRLHHWQTQSWWRTVSENEISIWWIRLILERTEHTPTEVVKARREPVVGLTTPILFLRSTRLPVISMTSRTTSLTSNFSHSKGSIARRVPLKDWAIPRSLLISIQFNHRKIFKIVFGSNNISSLERLGVAKWSSMRILAFRRVCKSWMLSGRQRSMLKIQVMWATPRTTSNLRTKSKMPTISKFRIHTLFKLSLPIEQGLWWWIQQMLLCQTRIWKMEIRELERIVLSRNQKMWQNIICNRKCPTNSRTLRSGA